MTWFFISCSVYADTVEICGCSLTTRKEKTVVDGGNNVKAWKGQEYQREYQRGRSSLVKTKKRENDMPALEELFDVIERQEKDVFEAAGEDAERSVRAVYEELIQATKKSDEATEKGDEEAVEEAERECEGIVSELFMLFDGLRVDLHNMAVDADALEEVVLEGYTFSDT